MVIDILIADPVKGKQIYHFTFIIAKQENQKSLALEVAIAFWDLLMADRFPHLDLWKEYLTVRSSTLKLLGTSRESYNKRYVEFVLGLCCHFVK